MKFSSIISIVTVQLILINVPKIFMAIIKNKINQNSGVCRAETCSRNIKQRGCLHGDLHIL